MTRVVAGGGYGKTTALRQLAASRPAAWLALAPADRAVEVLSAHAAEALGIGTQPGSERATPAIGAADRQSLAEGEAAAILQALDAHPEPILLVLDEVEHLADEDSATAFLSVLCLQAPSRVHIVLSGRRLPHLRLGSVRGRGELLEVTAPDLAFTPEEAAALLTARIGRTAESLADECWALTTGWPAAIQLIVDRLERREPLMWESTLKELGLRRGQMWRDFASEVIDGESSAARRILSIASIVPGVDPDLLSGLGIAVPEEELDSLQNRGLLVPSGERGARTLSPVLADAVAERIHGEEAEELRGQVATWLEGSGRLEEALESAARGPTPELVSLLRRCGRRLVTQGYGSRVAETTGALAMREDLELESIRAEALVAVGDWDGAMELFGAIERQTAPAPLPPPTAWRFGALLYLRGENEAAQAVLSAASSDGAVTGEDALVSAWLSSTYWSAGDVEEAQRTAEAALRQAEASGDPAARAAAYIAMALSAASIGDRERNERYYGLARRAAAEAGDAIQLARIHANLSSKALEEGDYQGAVDEADTALSVGAGHNLFGAIAMCNKAEARLRGGHLEEARALLVEAVDLFAQLGSLMAAAPYTVLGALEYERGHVVQARVALDRANRLAEAAGDVHSAVLALAGLAAVTAQEDPESAARCASEAVKRATSLERAHALCVSAWVALASGEHSSAGRFAAEAETEARRTSDRPSLARALELLGAASVPADEARLAEAAELWREIGDPIAEQRAKLMLAHCRHDANQVATLRGELSRRGVQADSGLVGLVEATPEQVSEVALTTLGQFAVRRVGQPVPLGAWQSRKARDLLKLLASRRGRPITRDAAAEALWPNEAAAPLSNRLSVALSTLRKVLDPGRAHPPDHFVAADARSLSLRIDHVSLDVNDFLRTAEAAVALVAGDDWIAAEAELRRAEGLYTGDFLEEDLYEDWPVDCREEARAAAQDVSRLLARAAVHRGDDEDASRHLRRLIEHDPYDGDAWMALLGTQLRMRRYGEARRQHAIYARRMADLEIPPLPLGSAIDALP